MALVTPSTISSLPTPPSTSDPANFDTQADAFLAGLPQLQAQVNVVAAQTNENAAWAQTKATESQTSATNSANSASASSASATSAASAGNAAQWLVGTSYALGACAWSPTTFQTFRRRTAGSGGVDPALDASGATWTQITVSPTASSLALLNMGII